MKKINPLQKEFFNGKAAIWDTISVHNLEKVGRIASLLSIRGDERILDVGTGTGVMIPFYEKYLGSGNVIAIDYSENMISVARSKYTAEEHPLVDFQVLDLYEMDFGPEFDIVTCYSCFPHFPDQPRAIKCLADVMRDGGRMMISHSDSRNKINRVHEEGGVVISNDFLPPMDEMKAMVEDAGLSVTFEEDSQDYYIMMAMKPF